MKLDSNGYMHPNLFGSEDGECYICKTVGPTARHEIFGASNRQKSKRLGEWISVCPRCHEMAHRDSTLRRKLQQEGQRRYQEVYGDDFLAIWGRNYL